MAATAYKTMTRRDRSNLRKGLLFISPWTIGFLSFVLYPLIYSFIMSFTRYSGFLAPVWLGIANYIRLFTDPLVWQSIYNTAFYMFWAIPVGLIVALLLALAMS